MSINRFEWLKALMQTELSPAAKNVATALAVQFANDTNGQCNPAQETLADYLKVHRDTVKRAIRELKNAGWLFVIAGQGRGRSSGYRLITPGKIVPFQAVERSANEPNTVPEKGDDLHPQTRKKGDDLHLKGGRSAPSHIRQEQSSEQRGAGPTECPVAQTAVIEVGSHREVAWNEWLSANRWPSLSELGIRLGAHWRMPFPMPPRNNDHQRRITEKYLNWASSRMIELRSGAA